MSILVKKSTQIFGLFVLLGMALGITWLVYQQLNASDRLAQASYSKIEWIQLIPKHELEILMNPPPSIENIEDGTEEDKLSTVAKNPEIQRYKDALHSTNIVSKFEQSKLMIPGFVVPLEFNEQKLVTRFFIVPYFGACIHLPPPPPNQVVYATYEQGLEQHVLYQPYWVAGVLESAIVKNDITTSAYTMQVDFIREYTEADDASYTPSTEAEANLPPEVLLWEEEPELTSP
ncbi:MAG: DUF3299 domain-containing protein [Shewanellaceae bacterium]|nr:DUF3299 domain-containing protein [Shewanellaceae bacterium]